MSNHKTAVDRFWSCAPAFEIEHISNTRCNGGEVRVTSSLSRHRDEGESAFRTSSVIRVVASDDSDRRFEDVFGVASGEGLKHGFSIRQFVGAVQEEINRVVRAYARRDFAVKGFAFCAVKSSRRRADRRQSDITHRGVIGARAEGQESVARVAIP